MNELNKLLDELTPDEKQKAADFATYLSRWRGRALLKFVKGIIEHRGEPPIDPDEEIEAEMMDIIAYQHLKQKQNNELPW